MYLWFSIFEVQLVYSLVNYAFHIKFLGNVSVSPCGGLILSWRRSLSYRNQSIDLLCKSMGWFLYDRDLHHERVSLKHFCEILMRKYSGRFFKKERPIIEIMCDTYYSIFPLLKQGIGIRFIWPVSDVV